MSCHALYNVCFFPYFCTISALCTLATRVCSGIGIAYRRLAYHRHVPPRANPHGICLCSVPALSSPCDDDDGDDGTKHSAENRNPRRPAASLRCRLPFPLIQEGTRARLKLHVPSADGDSGAGLHSLSDLLHTRIFVGWTKCGGTAHAKRLRSLCLGHGFIAATGAESTIKKSIETQDRSILIRTWSLHVTYPPLIYDPPV
jgi:hypothetical protein